MSPRAPLTLLLLGTACQFPQSHNTGFSSAPDVELTASTSTGADASGSTNPDGVDNTGSSGGSSTAASSSGLPATSAETTQSIPDAGHSADMGDASPIGCQGKIDFLFVISNEGVMQNVQPRQTEALPKFIATIQSKFADFDYHIMAVDSDKNWGHGLCNEECPQTGKCKWVADYPCDKLDLVGQCDKMIGAGNVFAAGYLSYNEPCSILGGKRYLTREQPNLAETFQCIAQIGSGGRGKMGEALAAAMSTQLGGVGGCNDGFLRKDALLMVTLIGSWDDEGDSQYSAGTPEEWAQAVVDRKDGNLDAVVMLDYGDVTLPWQDRIWKLTKMFKYNLMADLDSPDYGPAFEEATDLAMDACAGFSPPQ